jgi:hypothetical protein
MTSPDHIRIVEELASRARRRSTGTEAEED